MMHLLQVQSFEAAHGPWSEESPSVWVPESGAPLSRLSSAFKVGTKGDCLPTAFKESWEVA